MQLLTIPTSTPTAPVDDAYLSQGGLVDRQTAAAECVVLWTDAPLSIDRTLLPPAGATGCHVCAMDHAVH